MLQLYLKAPFAACRWFTAGWYRPTSGFLTPSAAYGFLLNVAGIESRLSEHEADHDGSVPATLMRSDLPQCRIALGLPEGASLPRAQSIFQQLHNYPVGRDAGMSPEIAKGNKNNVTPVRREFLTDLQAIIAMEASTDDSEFESRVVRGLRGELNHDRYGLPFVGDNNLLPDSVTVVQGVARARWYERVPAGEIGGPRQHVTRMTIWVDRGDMSRTRSALYAPAEAPAPNPPDTAWTALGPE